MCAFWETNLCDLTFQKTTGMHTAEDWESLEIQVPFLVIGASRLIPNDNDRAVVVKTHLELIAIYEKLKAWTWEQLPGFEDGLKRAFHDLVGLFKTFQNLVTLEGSEGLNIIKAHELLGFVHAVLEHGPIMNYSASAGEQSNKGLKEAYQHSDIRGSHSEVAAVLLERDVVLRAAKDSSVMSGTQANMSGHKPRPLNDISLAQYNWQDIQSGASGPALDVTSDHLIDAVKQAVGMDDMASYSVLSQALVPVGTETAVILRPGMCVELAPDHLDDHPSFAQIIVPLQSGSGGQTTIDFVCVRFFFVDEALRSHPEAPGIDFLYRGSVSADIGLYNVSCIRHRSHVLPYFGDDDPLKHEDLGAEDDALDSDGEENVHEYFLRNPFMWTEHKAPCEAANNGTPQLVYCPCPHPGCIGRAGRPQAPALGFQPATCGVCQRVVLF